MDVALSPAQRRFVDAQVASGRYADAGEVVLAALRRMEAESAASLGTPADGDVMALAFVVMKEASESAREDLKAIMAEVRAINAAKRALRELLCKIRRDAVHNAGRADGAALDFSRGLGSERAYHRVAMPRPDPAAPDGVSYAATDLHPQRITRAGELHALVERMKNDLDSMSEMGEMESLRLQMVMDRLSKMMSTLSNILKKISCTAAAITQNLK